jgi:hypothetical protein
MRLKIWGIFHIILPPLKLSGCWVLPEREVRIREFG